MVSSSVDTPLVVEVFERERPQFKRHPFKSVEDDPNCVFLSVPYGVLHVDDVRGYIHYSIEETENKYILTLYTNNIMDKVGNPKLKYAQLQRKCFTYFVHFSTFNEDEWVRSILSHVHDEFIWLERSYKITNQAIHAVTCLNQTSDKPN